MTNGTESGLAKTVANFAVLISACETFQEAYKPTQSSLTVQWLRQQLANAKESLLAVSQAKSHYHVTTSEREVVAKLLRPRATRVVNAAAASGMSSHAVDHVKSVNIKIQGKRVKAIVQPDATALAAGAVPVRTNSVSQQSFDSMIEHYTNLISSLATQPKYNPNEEELKLASLSNFLVDMKTKNSAVVMAYQTLTAARIARNTVMYKVDDGLIDTAREVKQYIKSVFGPSSGQYRQVSGLRFV